MVHYSFLLCLLKCPQLIEAKEMPNYLYVVPALCVALVGCASPGKPTASKLTSKTPQQYAACVMPQWQALAPNSTQKSIPHGVRMTAPSAVTTDDVLEVIESGEGSRATFYKGSFLSGDKLRVAARECLD